MALDFTQLRKKKDEEPPRILIYGMEKIGKTTLAAGAPDAVFLLTEDGVGLNELATTPVAKSYDEFVEYLSGLAQQDHPFRTLVIDSITGLERLVFAKVCEAEGVDSIEKAMGGFGKGYVRAVEYWQALLGMIDYVRREKRMMVILIGHADVLRFTPPDTEAYDRYAVRMNKNTIGAVQKWVDDILFIKKQVSLVKDKNSERKRAVGGSERYIYTAEQPAFFAGNRHDLPEVIGPVSKGAPELWAILAQHVPFLIEIAKAYGAEPALTVSAQAPLTEGASIGN